MLVTLEPKQSFQKNEDQAKEFRAIVDSTVFKEGVHKAIAEFVLRYSPTAEELSGVNRFLKVLINMAEKEEPPVTEPFMRSIATLIPKPQPKK